MIDQDIVFAKIANIQSCLKRIQAVTRMDPSTLDNLDIRILKAILREHLVDLEDFNRAILDFYKIGK